GGSGRGGGARASTENHQDEDGKDSDEWAHSRLPSRRGVALQKHSAKKSRPGSRFSMARQLEHFENLVSLFLTRAGEKGDKPFLWAKREGAWRSTSWAEAARQVAALAGRLRRIGLQPGDRVALVSENRPEWLIADLGIMAAGCITVPAYTTNTIRDHAHVLGNSGARAVIVSSQKLARNLVPAVLTSTECHQLIGMEDIRAGQLPDWVSVHRWSDLAPADGDVAPIKQHATAIGRADLACIIYTTGTGAAPRVVPQHQSAT